MGDWLSLFLKCSILVSRIIENAYISCKHIIPGPSLLLCSIWNKIAIQIVSIITIPPHTHTKKKPSLNPIQSLKFDHHMTKEFISSLMGEPCLVTL